MHNYRKVYNFRNDNIHILTTTVMSTRTKVRVAVKL